MTWSNKNAGRAISEPEKTFQEILERVYEILKAKNRDYGDDNLRRYGVYGILIRMTDKMERLKNLMLTQQNHVGESLEKEFVDIIGYAVQANRFLNEDENITLQGIIGVCFGELAPLILNHMPMPKIKMDIDADRKDE